MKSEDRGNQDLELRNNAGPVDLMTRKGRYKVWVVLSFVTISLF